VQYQKDNVVATLAGKVGVLRTCPQQEYKRDNTASNDFEPVQPRQNAPNVREITWKKL
jgi:hypothetical protein